MRFSLPLCGFSLTFCLDGFRLLYASIAVFMWAVSLGFTPRYFRGHSHTGRYYFFTVLTFLATTALFLSDDLYCTFIFLEIMSFASYPWVAQEETPGALRAAATYLAVAVFGGMVTLMGLFMLYNLAGSLSFEALRSYAASLPDPSPLYAPAILAFTGFAAKAGVFPLHIWLPKAHPVAPAPASALLSGILTKTGIFGMAVLSMNLFFGDRAWGSGLLIPALITMVLGALMAVFSTDLKHTLACSSMSQIGFILTGLAFSVLLGEENALGARGTLLHMVNHSLIKLDLFLCAGAVYMNTHHLDLTVIRGFGRKKPFLHCCFLMGYLGIIGLPLFNGYLSKSLIHEAILEFAAEAHTGAFWYLAYEKLFLFSGGLTAAYMTKLYLCLFIFRNRDEALQKKYDGERKYLPPLSALCLFLASLLPPALGLLPDLTASPLLEAAMPFLRGGHLHHAIAWFSAENLKGAAVSLAIGGAVCFLIHRFLVKKGEYLNRWPAWLDLENLVYRPLVTRLLPALGGFFASCCDRVLDNRVIRVWIPAAVSALTGIADRILDNRLIRTWIPAAVTALSRLLDQSMDAAAVLLSRTLFRHQRVRDHSLPVADEMLLAEARHHEKATQRRNQRRHRSGKPVPDYVARAFSRKNEAVRADRLITRSMSFGLLLLALGLCAALIYLLMINA